MVIIAIIALVVIVGIALTVINAMSAPTTQAAKVGDTLTIGGVSATLTGVGGALSYDTPAPGQPEQVAAHIKLVNNSGSEQAYSSYLNFHVKSGAGTITSVEIIAPSFYQGSGLLGSGKLLPGGSVEGDIILSVIVGDHQAELTWQPTASDSDNANGWILGVQD
jgi:hypothetical protein